MNNQEDKLLQYNEMVRELNRNMVLDNNDAVELCTNGEWGRMVGITCFMFDIKEESNFLDGVIEAETLNKVISFVANRFNVNLTYWIDIDNVKVMYIIKNELEEIKKEAKMKCTI